MKREMRQIEKKIRCREDDMQSKTLRCKRKGMRHEVRKQGVKIENETWREKNETEKGNRMWLEKLDLSRK